MKVLKGVLTPVKASTAKRPAATHCNLAVASPEWLRERVFSSLRRLPPEERESARDRILADLKRAGVNIGSALLILGIPALTPDELSPSDIAKLVRYVRINTPKAMTVLSRTLGGLIAPEAPEAKAEKPLRRAA
ncbi:MAG TPA: hypothetical protein VNO14_04150 [Blastocatellia bacterium]|nr:hypothetical protein [Blastocatellia bacterium]